MYYAPATPGNASQEKPGSILIPGQGPYAHVPPGFAPQQVMPNGLTSATPRFAHHAAPQAYAVVSAAPGSHPAYAAANVYSSMPYPGLAGMAPTSSHAYIPAQFPAGIGYQTAALAGRSAPPAGAQYTLPMPAQAAAGAPLFAAGYTPVPAGLTGPGPRGMPYGPMAAAASQYPPGYAYPTASSEGTAPVGYQHPNFVPQF